MNNKGSIWRKWDLHFHTPTSYDYQAKSLTNAEIIKNLADHGVAVVAVTDHHVMDIGRILELQEIGKANAITVLPGIEFLSSAAGREPVHFIGIFPEDCNLEHVWGQIKHKTNISQIESQGRAINEVYCEIITTSSLIKELGGIVTIHAGGKSNSLENITHSLPQGIAQKLDIAAAIDVFEMGAESDCDGYNSTVIPYLINNIHKHIPMILCSDNHKASDYKVKQNLWIKADPTFEGFKQILYEPVQRVKIQSDKPDFKEEKLIIDQVSFISNGKFSPEPIHLNENLNVIIGGKSSGKSILLYHIAKTLIADKGFMAKEGIADKYQFLEDDSSFNFEIKTKGGFSQFLYRDEAENSLIPDIKYIPQNYLIKLAEPEEYKKGNALNEMIRDLIKEDEASRLAYESFLSKVKQNDRTRTRIIDEYFETKQKIEGHEKLLATKPKPDILSHNIRANEGRVTELNKNAGLSDEDIAKYNLLLNNLEQERIKRQQASTDWKNISDFLPDIQSTLVSANSKAQAINQNLGNAEMKASFGEIITELSQFQTKVNEFTEKFATTEKGLFKNASNIQNIFITIDNEIARIEKLLEPFLKTEETKKEADKLLKLITADKQTLSEIDILKKQIVNEQANLANIKDSLFNHYKENFDEYGHIIGKLKERTVDLEKDGLKIDGLIRFNYSRFRSDLDQISDGRKASYRKYDIYEKEKTALSDFTLTEILSDLSLMFDDIAEKNEYVLVSRVSQKMAIEQIFADYFFDYWQIEYKGDKLGKMSTGKASFVILMLIIGLSSSKAPILIDQPEDNLDNRSITTDLVEYLRLKKLERQIILVTHNPNIVVNADAENIIIANQRGQNGDETESRYSFDYINGALENSFVKDPNEKDLLKSMGIREHIAEIVEGGKEAFKKREEKYGFSN